MNKLEIEYVNIDGLRPYKNNAKIHTKEQIAQIKKSIEEFGINDPVAIWNDEIVEGHGRLIAAKELGIETVPVVRLDDLSDEQRRAYGLVHNKLTMNTEFDDVLVDFDLLDIDLDLTFYGFGSEESCDSVTVDAEGKEKTYSIASMELKAFEHHDYIVFVFDNIFDWENTLSYFNVEKIDYGYDTSKVGLGRVIDGCKLVEALGD